MYSKRVWAPPSVHERTQLPILPAGTLACAETGEYTFRNSLWYLLIFTFLSFVVYAFQGHLLGGDMAKKMTNL